MNAPRTPAASTVAPLLAVLALFAPTAARRAAVAVWRLPASLLAFLGAWVAPGFWVSVAADEEHAAATRAVLGAGYAIVEPPTKALDALASALVGDRPQHTVDSAALNAFAESLPAIVTHLDLRIPGDGHARALDASHLRALLRGVSGRVAVSRVVYRDTLTHHNVAALAFEGANWRALLRTYDAGDIKPAPPCFDAENPVALACAACGVVCSSRFCTADSAHVAALARRWTLRDTDEGEAFACRQCSARRPT